MKLAVIDFETTGLDSAKDHIIDAAVAVLDTATWTVLDRYDSLNEPPVPIPAEITAITGITDEDVRGRRMEVPLFLRMCDTAELIVAHNATFDRGFFERHLQPDAAARRWACTMSQIEWHAVPSLPKCRCLRHLAWELYVDPFRGHRAHGDVGTLVEMLKACHPLTGRRIGEMLIEAASASWSLVRAVGAPFDSKDVLKDAGWRWSPGTKTWWRIVREEQLPELAAWMLAQVYGGSERLAGQKVCRRGIDPLRPDFEAAYGL